jgi:copper chaperone CopZ
MTHARAGFVVSLVGLLVLSLTHDVAAQPGQPFGMLEVSVQVDGLSCPFCAYGLEKKLKKVDHVASLEIQVNEGRAVLTLEPGTSLDLAALEQAVRDGGFTPGGLTLTARGRLGQLHGAPALELSDGTVLLLAEGGRADELLTLTNGSAVQVEGHAVLEQTPDHTAHPYTLTVNSFETL